MPDEFERAERSLEDALDEVAKAQESIGKVMDLLRFTDYAEDIRDVAASVDTIADDMTEIIELIRKGA